MNNGIRRVLVVALLAAGLAVAGGAKAAISSVSGQIVQISPPPSVMFDGDNGALESNDHMFTFEERQNVTLASDLATDISQPGTYGPDCGCNPLTPGSIAAGTTVSSVFVHADPVGSPSKPNVLQATVVTDSDILGIEVCGNASPHCGVNGLDISDPILGAPGTLYPTDVFGRSMNFSTQKDFLIWVIDNRTVMIQTATRQHADQIRIITKGTPPPGTIIVKKITDPNPDPSNSSFTFTGDAAGQIGNGQSITVNNLAPGTYHSTEVVPSGWQLGSISCDDSNSSGDTSTATATFHVEPGETVTCTFVDRRPATIIVKKVTDPNPDPTNSSFTFTGDAAGSIGNGQSITVGNLAPGTYHSTEVVPSGWQLGSISCDDSNSSGNVSSATATFNVTAGETVTCTFVDRRPGTIIVKKVTNPNPDPSNSSFTFTGDAAGSIANGQTITVGNLAPGTYHSSEVVPSGWLLTSISCSDSNSTGDIVSSTATFHVEAGETVTCTFTDRKQATIIVKKITDPSPDLSNSSFTFTGNAAGQIKNGETITVGNLGPGTYTSHEVVPMGWQLMSISCSDSNSTGSTYTATATFRVETGETVTCTFVDKEKLGSQGCSLGYWKQSQHFHSWTGVSPTDSFETVFGVDAFPGNPTLLDVLWMGGGGVNALGRQAVAALLNALSPQVAFPITSGQVITQTRNAILSHNAWTIAQLSTQYDGWNNRCTCGLN
jgi:plastocyanin